MSEEQTKLHQKQQQNETPKEEVKVEETKQNTFTQEQLDNIIKSRLEAEQSKVREKTSRRRKLEKLNF
jgi:hypothetical protein